MQIIGFNFEKIEAERKKPVVGKIEVNSNIDIEDIEESKLDVIKDKSALKLSFDFKIKYKPEIAEINLRGSVLLLTEKDEAKSILKKWKVKKISDEIRIPIFNVILTKANLRALQLEEELNLPTHIPLPKIKSKTEKENNRSYTG